MNGRAYVTEMPLSAHISIYAKEQSTEKGEYREL